MIFRARYAMTPGVPLIENAVLEVRGERVLSLRCGGAGEGAGFDFGDALLLPGLVNAHTHLELSGLAGRVPFDGRFARWVERVIELAPLNESEERARSCIRDGLRASLRGGVTTVGDVGYGPHQLAELSAGPLRAVCFREVLGIGSKRDAALAWLQAGCEGVACDPPRVWAGLSPHAPYSTDAAVYRAAIAAAEAHGWALCTHLAETREELAFLLEGTGPLRDLLERRGLVDGSFVAEGCGPVEFAERVGLLESAALLVHVNYLSDRGLEMVAGSSCSVAYCPRAHAFFGHEPHRFREMDAAGVNVCLGTDSLASNESLSILDEWRFLHGRYAELDLAALLRLSTVNAAAALGIDGQVGSLEPSKLADFIVLPVAARNGVGVCEQVLTEPIQPRAVYVGGRKVLG